MSKELNVWLNGLSNKPTRVSVGVPEEGALSLGEASGSEVTSAISAGVKPILVRLSARVATFTSTMAELSITLTPTMVRTLRSLPTGAKNQKLSVNPSPSLSLNVRATILRGVFSTHSSLLETPLALGFSMRPMLIGSSSLMKLGSVFAAEAFNTAS